MERLPEINEADMMELIMEPKDIDPNYIQDALDYMGKLKTALPEFISNSISDDIETITDLINDNEWTINLIQRYMDSMQLCALSMYAKRLQGFDILAGSVARKVIEEKDIGEIMNTASMTLSVVADYVIRIIVSINPSIFDEAMKLREDTK